MKLLFTFLIALSILESVESVCKCYADQYVSSTIAAVTIGAPTETGAFGSPACPIGADSPFNCTTIVAFYGDLANGLPAGATISIVQCGGLSTDNTVTLVEKNQTFTSCPSGVYKFPMDYTSNFTFVFRLKTPINFTVVLQPLTRVPATTTAPPASTTPSYVGPFPNNPAISRMDLTIGLDVNMANQQFYTQSKELITNIVQYFAYTPEYVRLSFMTFDPFGASGTGKYPLWSHNNNTMSDDLSSMPFYPGNNSIYFSALDTFFFSKLGAFPLRDNTQRVFIIFTGTDAVFENQYKTSVPAQIDQYDIKFIYVNLNTAISTASGPGTYYQNLALLTGKDSDASHWFDYQLNQNNAENLLKKFYFDGNALCNVPASTETPVQDGSPAPYSVPVNPLPNKFYCNYMNDVRTYTNPGPSTSVLQVSFSSYDMSNEKDVIRIGVNGTEVSVLTGQYGSAYYCIPGTPITVTFQSKNGVVYNGYTSTVKFFADMTTCKNTKPSRMAAFIDHTKKQ